jgi:nucleotide-binding universal stress UspA family protein
MREIVVGSDGSTASQPAVELAGRLCRETGARLTVLNVQRLSPALASPVPAVSDLAELRGAVERQVRAQAAGVLGPLGVDWRLETGSGDPAGELDRAADRHGADLIVVGGRGHSMAHRILLGSVASRLAHHAHHPVLVVR